MLCLQMHLSGCGRKMPKRLSSKDAHFSAGGIAGASGYLEAYRWELLYRIVSAVGMQLAWTQLKAENSAFVNQVCDARSSIVR